jgi:hypothetical protein
MCLTILLYLREGLMAEGEEDSVVIKLGSSYIKGLPINWEELIVNSLKLDLI